MKILYVITGLGGGGAEKVVCDLADQMQGFGHTVKIAYMKGPEPIVKPLSSEIELIYLGFESVKFFFTASKNFQNFIKEFKPDIVHAHMIHANIFARLNRIFINMPKLICTAHNANEGGTLRMRLYSLTNSLSDLNTNVSNEALEAFIKNKAFNADSITIYNGINLRKFYFFKKQRKKIINILAVGRLNEQKDYPNFLKALSLLPDKQMFNIRIAGDGEEKNLIEKLITEYNLESTVELLGRREDIPELFKETDIFVLSSAYEGFGLVVAEAMASNTFVVATDCGGVKEVMGGTGILVPPKNSVELSRAILKAANLDENEISINNEKAYQHVKLNFDLNNIVNRWLEIYEQ